MEASELPHTQTHVVRQRGGGWVSNWVVFLLLLISVSLLQVFFLLSHVHYFVCMK